MIATVIPIRQAITWNAVRERHDHALQMAEQTVEAFAEVGDMLIALKNDNETQHGEFMKRCAETFFKGKTPSYFSDQQLNAAKERAASYMRLASHREAWQPKHPKSLRDAIKMVRIPKPAKETVYRESWPDVLLRNAVIDPVLLKGGSEVGVRKKIQKAGIALPDTGYFSNAADADQFVLAYARAFPQEEPFKHTLTKSDEKKVARAIALEKERMRGLFDKEVYAVFLLKEPELKAENDKFREELREETQRYHLLNTNARKMITEKDYRILRSIVHPDHAPKGLTEEEKKKYHEGFIIVEKLKDYAEA